MKRNPFGIETKPAAAVGTGVGVGAVVSLVFGLAANYHWFTPPSPYLTGLIVTVASGVLAGAAGYRAPHTPRPAALQSAQERADFEEWTAAGKPLIRFGGPASSLWSYSTSPVPPDGPGTPPATEPAP